MPKVVVPATSANLGSGFDCAGLCLSLLDEFVFSEIDGPFSYFVDRERADVAIVTDDNLLFRAINFALDVAGRPSRRLEIRATNRIPFARGLGSSAAAIVGGLMIGNYLSGSCFSQADIFQMAVNIEGHSDNVAPAVYGGFCLSYCEENQQRVKKIEPHPDLKITVAIPDYKSSTEVARKCLPGVISLEDCVHSAVRVGLLTTGIIQNDGGSLRAAMDDRLHQAYRLPMLPGVQEAINRAMESGSYFAVLSGSGPTVIAISLDADVDLVGREMVAAFRRVGISANYMLLQPQNNGAELVESE